MGCRHIKKILSDARYSLKDCVENIIPDFLGENTNQAVRTEKPTYAEIVGKIKEGGKIE